MLRAALKPKDNFFKSTQRRKLHETGIWVFNTLEKKKVPFNLPSPHHTIRWYTCGPTVYDFSHMGHARNYVTNDIIHRIIQNYFGYEIDHVLGMTDIDDKIVAKAKTQNKSPEEIAKFFEKDFFGIYPPPSPLTRVDDMDSLGISKPNRIGRVTEHIQEIIEFIQQIEKNGHCYTSNDSVYFDTTSIFSHKLNPHRQVDDGSDGFSSDTHLSEKRSPKDFALWKKSSENEVGWPNPFATSIGRPGWHIECSAIASHHLGNHFDVHSGGIDLCFPHHNNEIAQSDACFGYKSDGPQWVSYFLHVGHLHIRGRKMSKSLKNFVTIKEFLSSYGKDAAQDFRMFCLLVPWDSDVDFSEDRISDARAIKKKFTSFLERVATILDSLEPKEHVRNLQIEKRNIFRELQLSQALETKWGTFELALWEQITQAKTNFSIFTDLKIVRESLQDNFNTELALKHLADLITHTNHYVDATFSKTSTPSLSLIRLVIEFLLHAQRSFGTELSPLLVEKITEPELNENGDTESNLLQLVVDLRQEIKKILKEEGLDKKKLFAVVDRIRDKDLPAIGFQLKDTPVGSVVTKSAPTE